MAFVTYSTADCCLERALVTASAMHAVQPSTPHETRQTRKVRVAKKRPFNRRRSSIVINILAAPTLDETLPLTAEGVF